MTQFSVLHHKYHKTELPLYTMVIAKPYGSDYFI